jgi:polyphosphate kinase
LTHQLTNRDISWLSFNERVLQEAARQDVPLLERLKFLSIYSSNLDEFYRVRMPALLALHHLGDEVPHIDNRLAEVNDVIGRQQQAFGQLLRNELIPLLEENKVKFIYNQPIPQVLKGNTRAFFMTQIAAFIQRVELEEQPDFFPENNKIYLCVVHEQQDEQRIAIVNIPSEECGRFYQDHANDIDYVITLDDIIKDNLALLFPMSTIFSANSFKITRDAELDLEDEFKGDIAQKIEEEIQQRDLGLATRFLYDAAMPKPLLDKIISAFNLKGATLVEGGRYHNLKDLNDFPLAGAAMRFDKWPAVPFVPERDNIFDSIATKDVLLHVPYQSYDTILQFFNQAAIDPDVTDVSVTLYRIAGNSLIGNALISAAKNGKNVTVFVELKARFDEANNIRWAKKMKAAGVKIIYSIPGLKVHAKVALVKRRVEGRTKMYGIFATGNFNESTAKFYTDHILMTAQKDMLMDLDLLFIFLAKRRKPGPDDIFRLQHLLIAQFNLQADFLSLIENEIAFARQNLPAAITIKLNNLEEEVMISKLYEASQAGVKINLIVRGICRLKPGVAGLSENIQVRRIVDRYLEHGRIFIFQNNNEPRIFMGSADWMSRNIYRRIEVCFPIFNPDLKTEILELIQLQLEDNVSAVLLNEDGQNVPLKNDGTKEIRSQYEIYQMIKTKKA